MRSLLSGILYRPVVFRPAYLIFCREAGWLILLAELTRPKTWRT
jgi:hypothetical protein